MCPYLLFIVKIIFFLFNKKEDFYSFCRIFNYEIMYYLEKNNINTKKERREKLWLLK